MLTKRNLPREQVLDLAARCGVKGAEAALVEFASLVRGAEPLAASEMRPAPVVQEAKPVGVAGTMPGTTGFTMVCFKASDVPVGTHLFLAAPTAQEAEQASAQAWLHELPAGEVFGDESGQSKQICWSEAEAEQALEAHGGTIRPLCLAATSTGSAPTAAAEVRDAERYRKLVPLFKYDHISQGRNGYHCEYPIPGDDMDFGAAVDALLAIRSTGASDE